MTKGYTTSERDRERLREYREKNKDQIRAYFVANREELNRKRRHRYATDANYRKRVREETAAAKRRNPAARLNSRMKAYGIDLNVYKEMLITQEGKCAICQKPGRDIDALLTESETPRLAVDHCHSTGAVRGLLCDGCNLGLGKFGDAVDLLERAIAYLKRHGGDRR